MTILQEQSARQGQPLAPPQAPLVDAILALAGLHLDEGWAHDPSLRLIAVGLVGGTHQDEVSVIAGHLRMAEAIACGTEPSHDPSMGERDYRTSATHAAQQLASLALAERRAS